MWKDILLVVGVVLAAIAVWLLFGMRDDTREQFINCKVENIQLTIQYGRCLDELEKAGHNSQSPGTGAEGSSTAPDPGGMILVPDPGGMITVPDPGGMIVIPNAPHGKFVFEPSGYKLQECGARNQDFREALVACANVLANTE